MKWFLSVGLVIAILPSMALAGVPECDALKGQAAIDAKKLDPKETVTAEALIKAGVIRRARDGVRLLGDGEIKVKLVFEVAGASKTAIEKIEKAGGSVKLPEVQAAE